MLYFFLKNISVNFYAYHDLKNYQLSLYDFLKSVMSKNKYALIRYQALDRCFRNTGRRYYWEDLLEECNKSLLLYDSYSEGIQRRQLFDDIQFMESDQGWSIPLERIRDGRKVYYRYEDSSFSINNQGLNETEAVQMKKALQILTRFTGTPQFEWVHEMIPMLESKFGFIQQNGKVIDFESNIDLRGIHFLTPLFNAIINERVLKVRYKDFKSDEPYEFILHPHYLKQYNGRWFVFGLHEENQSPTWNLAIDRMEGLTETNLKYCVSKIDWDDYFYDIIGVTKLEGICIEEVIMLFSKEAAPYVITKPLHPSQRHTFRENGLHVTIKVIPNYELERLILSYGDQVEVLAPENLKEKIESQIKKMYHAYFS